MMWFLFVLLFVQEAFTSQVGFKPINLNELIDRSSHIVIGKIVSVESMKLKVKKVGEKKFIVLLPSGSLFLEVALRESSKLREDKKMTIKIIEVRSFKVEKVLKGEPELQDKKISTLDVSVFDNINVGIMMEMSDSYYSPIFPNYSSPMHNVLRGEDTVIFFLNKKTFSKKDVFYIQSASNAYDAPSKDLIKKITDHLQKK